VQAKGWCTWPRGIDINRLQAARQATIADNHPSALQMKVHKVLVSLLATLPGLLWVSEVEHGLPDVLWRVDMLLHTLRSHKIILEVDGPTHRLGPHGSLSGSTFWRNEVLTALGYIVIMVTSEEWDAADSLEQKRELLIKKLQEAKVI